MRGDRLVLRDFNLEIGVGEHVAILGPNGCGKSTLIRTLTRDFYPLARPGTVVRIFGQERWNVFELRSLLGIVPSSLPHLSKIVTGREMVLSGFFSSVGIWPNHEVTPVMVRKADEVLEHLDAAHLAERDFEELSSGEARRLLIARALVHSPKALLLDEPSTSLDLFAQHELRETMRKLAQAGIGILLVTHHLSDIIPEIARVVMLKDGQVLADGPRASMLTRERIEGLFGVPVELSEREGYVHAW
jgi:iron complex transport system ATP-binding protein